MHKVGDLVRNAKNGWLGRVLAVGCTVCGEDHGTCPHEGGACLLTIGQLRIPGDRRPWCLPENFPVVGPTAWERLMNEPLVGEVSDGLR